MIDGGLWGEVRDRLPRGAHAQRIETGLTAWGVPDVNVCLDGQEIWLELKATSGWTPKIRPGQIGWAEQRCRAGGRVWMLTWRRRAGGPRSAAASELWVHLGTDMRHVHDGGLRAASPVHVSTGGPTQWDWETVWRLTLRSASL